jgi:hypothetical protein
MLSGKQIDEFKVFVGGSSATTLEEDFEYLIN